jgi:protein-L-isoaspartate(D-aspartate) O-methyltransferase
VLALLATLTNKAVSMARGRMDIASHDMHCCKVSWARLVARMLYFWNNVSRASHGIERSAVFLLYFLLGFFTKRLFFLNLLYFAINNRNVGYMNLEQARFNMVEQQIRTWEVLDQDVLDLLFEMKREEFLPDRSRALAFVDMQAPIGFGEFTLAPKLEARILQEVSLKKSDRVLEIGTGCGYMTALLAKTGQHVTSVEIVPELSAFAEKNLRVHGIDNVVLAVGDGARGWQAGSMYDVIVLTGSTPMLPDAFIHALQPGGRLFAVVGEDPLMKALLISKGAQDGTERHELFETCIPALKNALPREQFVF